MEINRKMNISADKLFDMITRSVLYDIEKQTGKSVDIGQMSQFEYVKTFSKNSSAKIRIEAFEKNSAYHYRTHTTKNNFFVKYDIESISVGSCKLTYSEQIESYGHMQKLNDALVGTILNRLKKKRFIEMLKSMEKS